MASFSFFDRLTRKSTTTPKIVVKSTPSSLPVTPAGSSLVTRTIIRSSEEVHVGLHEQMIIGAKLCLAATGALKVSDNGTIKFV